MKKGDLVRFSGEYMIKHQTYVEEVISKFPRDGVIVDRNHDQLEVFSQNQFCSIPLKSPLVFVEVISESR